MSDSAFVSKPDFTQARAPATPPCTNCEARHHLALSVATQLDTAWPISQVLACAPGVNSTPICELMLTPAALWRKYDAAMPKGPLKARLL